MSRIETIGNATLYLGDCREILPTLPKVDAVVTDPPWMARKDKITRRSKGVARIINPSVGIGYGSIGELDINAIEAAFNCTDHDMLVICGYKELGQIINALDPIRGVFVWHKPNGGISVAYPSPLDVAYIVWGARRTSKITGFQHWRSAVMSHSVPTAGCISNGERILDGHNGKALHPCQGPVSLYKQLIKPIKGTILDPFMGSGTAGVAAIELGQKFIGVEMEPKYFDICCKRIEEATKQPDMFIEIERRAEQIALDIDNGEQSFSLAAE